MASTSSLGAQGGTSANFAATFYEFFNARLQALRSQIDSASTLDQLSSSLTELLAARAELTEATDKLPTHDRGVHEASLRDCTATLTKRRSALTPKSTFAFRRKAPVTPATPTVSEAPVAPIIEARPRSLAAESNSSHLSLSNRKDEQLYISSLPHAATLHISDLQIQDLQNCIVDFRQAPSAKAQFAAMQVRNVRRCVLLLSSVSGAVMMHDCESCLVVLQCAQFRMHTSKRMMIMLNLHARASRATIEHCTEVRFAAAPHSLLAPVPIDGASVERSEQAKIAPVVQDFDHPGAGNGPSPSWSKLEDGTMEMLESFFGADKKADEDVEGTLRRFVSASGWSE